MEYLLIFLQPHIRGDLIRSLPEARLQQVAIAKNSQTRIPGFFMGRPRDGFKRDPLADQPHIRAQLNPSSATIRQLLDHFTPSDGRTWKQRYFYNMKYYKPTGPVFLMLGGESPEDPAWVSYEELPWVKWAKKHGAALFSLEHRFYGESRPFPTLATENLKYLSSKQGVEDAAYFIRYINKRFNFVNTKWVVFGGSYSGALAAWLREKHPELVVGAVASSAPVEAKLDFHEYLEVVQKDIRSCNVTCASAIGETFKEMSEFMWTEEGRTNLTETFLYALHIQQITYAYVGRKQGEFIYGVRPGLNDISLGYKETELYFRLMFTPFQFIAQNGGERFITAACQIMTYNGMTYFNRLKLILVILSSGGRDYQTDIDYDALITELKNTEYNRASASTRSWIWQTCTEFGYFQTTDLGRNIFGSGSPMNLEVDMCNDIFGPEHRIETIDRKIHETLEYFGGSHHFNGTNVVFPNGNIDPWHALGLYSSKHPSVVPILINGTVHCQDMQPERPSDPPSLVKARKIIASNIDVWLRGEQKQQEVKAKMPEVTSQIKKTRSKLPKMKQFSSVLRAVPLKPIREELYHTETIPQHLNPFIWGRPLTGLVVDPPAPIDMAAYPKGFVAGTITMPVDHFNATNTNTFNQRYWMNPQYAKPRGPHFLMIGGEGTANTKWVLNPEVQIMSAARKYGATVYMLEHRYYGESWPTPDQSTENLKWLTSQQALADLAQFIKTMNKEQKLVNPQWITFGGSYPGMLSAWFRQFYPELTVGALASSAPIGAKVDFYEYLIVVANSLRFFNPKCADNVGNAFDEMRKLSLTQEGRAYLTNIFTLKPEWTAQSTITDVDMQYFFSNIYSNFQGAVQYNNDNSGKHAIGGGINDVCKYMVNNTKTAIENVADVNAYIAKFWDGYFNYTDNRYENYVDYLKDITAMSASRSWTYQTCNEFGFFQSTDIGENMFGGPTPVNFFIDTCLDAFGPTFTPKYVYEANEKSHNYYGGVEYYHGTNVFFTNGNIDPWHALSKYNGIGSVTTVLMNGTAHCADMYPPRKEDAPDLAPTRALIERKIGEWLGEHFMIPYLSDR
ncbi:unnamed protein product [Anisakis simplex]|uniref:Serine protease K12H4.7 n=1 Tax=Anisakis simplex TaxID=6269 RepID=A0A0M3IYC1_ANISI|nr:unnamed protein product [Anisakis simplex]